MRIFVSYTLRDSIVTIESLRRIAHSLSSYGLPFVDVIHNSSRHSQGYLEDMLARSDIMLACVSPRYHQSEWVQRELAIAQERAIPVRELFVSQLRDGSCALRHIPSLMRSLGFGNGSALLREVCAARRSGPSHAPK